MFKALTQMFKALTKRKGTERKTKERGGKGKRKEK